MNYLTVSLSSLRLMAELTEKSGQCPDSESIDTFLRQHAQQAFPGEDNFVDLSSLEVAVKQLTESLETWKGKDKDGLEGILSGLVHDALHNLPLEVLDDPGFWQYLCIKYFLPFVAWREAGSLSSGNLLTYLSGNRNSEQIPLRLYLRGSISGRDDNYARTVSIKRATDFWRSHLVRVAVGNHHVVAREIIDLQANDAMSTALLRQFARLVNRMGSNIELYALSPEGAQEILKRTRQQATRILSNTDENSFAEDGAKA